MKLPESFTKVTPFSKILTMVLFILFPILGFYLGTEYQNAIILSKTIETNESIPKQKSTIEKCDYTDTTGETLDEFKRILKEVYSGIIFFEKNEATTINTYFHQLQISSTKKTKKGIEPTTQGITVQVYKYISGQKMQMGYEGGQWSIDMDSWVSYLKSININTKRVRRVSYWGVSDVERPILVKSYNNRVYAIYDDGFKPAGTVSRHFDSFDSVNNQIITIEARVSFPEFNSATDSALFKYTDDTETFFNSVEKAISDVK